MDTRQWKTRPARYEFTDCRPGIVCITAIVFPGVALPPEAGRSQCGARMGARLNYPDYSGKPRWSLCTVPP